ncbi:preprotein translocase subunit YajC [Sporolactobacillus sp. THM7-7]|nr:preprotein translocase subunit YajC [Sporolactobacillus sp. THM7-7]
MELFGTIIPLILFIGVFYFFLIRPQQKRAKETRSMQEALSKGDKVITIGGLQGTIDSIDDQTVVLRCSGSKLTFERSAVRAVLRKAGEHEKAND